MKRPCNLVPLLVLREVPKRRNVLSVPHFHHYHSLHPFACCSIVTTTGFFCPVFLLACLFTGLRRRLQVHLPVRRREHPCRCPSILQVGSARVVASDERMRRREARDRAGKHRLQKNQIARCAAQIDYNILECANVRLLVMLSRLLDLFSTLIYNTEG